jgi:D-lactate dehydrogenase
MKVAVFSTKPYDREFFKNANAHFNHELVYLEPHLSLETVSLASGFSAVCVFVNDQLTAPVLEALSRQGTKLVALRCAGYNNVDLSAAAKLGITVVRVPAYSPYAVAEHTVGLMLELNRKLNRSYNRVREGNFSLDGLLGFDLHGKTVGIIGMGQIGTVVAKILNGFGCHVLVSNPHPDLSDERELDVHFVSLEELFRESDIITLHCPLTPETCHLINEPAISQMKQGVMLINTSRGGIVDTQALITGLKSGKIGYLGLDVYEEEANLFFEDLSCKVIPDDTFSRLLTFPNVIVTGHQAFFTQEALEAIAQTTLSNIAEFEQKHACQNQVLASC